MGKIENLFFICKRKYVTLEHDTPSLSCSSWEIHLLLGWTYLIKSLQLVWNFFLSQMLPSHHVMSLICLTGVQPQSNYFVSVCLQLHLPSLSKYLITLKKILQNLNWVSCHRPSYDGSLPINFSSLSRDLI